MAERSVEEERGRLSYDEADSSLLSSSLTVETLLIGRGRAR